MKQSDWEWMVMLHSSKRQGETQNERFFLLQLLLYNHSSSSSTLPNHTRNDLIFFSLPITAAGVAIDCTLLLLLLLFV